MSKESGAARCQRLRLLVSGEHAATGNEELSKSEALVGLRLQGNELADGSYISEVSSLLVTRGNMSLLRTLC